MHKPAALAALVSLSLCAPLVFANPTVPDRLQKVDKVTYCSGMDSPPLVSFDDAQKPVGLTIDLGVEIAKRLGGKKVSGGSFRFPAWYRRCWRNSAT